MSRKKKQLHAKLAEEPAPFQSAEPHPHRPLHCVDLFAGCGGLSLGLEQAGFHPLLFSEINPSASETYIANRVGMDLVPVGDVYNLTDTDLRLLKLYWSYKGIADVDLVCGGPPCQGYSGIGHRRTFNLAKKDIPSNQLFKEMVRVIRAIRPKAFLFENVRGLLNSRWTPNGKSGEIFRAVLAEFGSLAGYRIHWSLLHAKDYGVPQNRPRVIMIGLREDVLQSWPRQRLRGLSDEHPDAVEEGFLPKPSGTPPTLPELLGDLEDPECHRKPETRTYLSEPVTDIQRKLRTTREGLVLGLGAPVTEQEYSSHAPYIREKFLHMIRNDGQIPAKFQTKKFAQRVFPIEWDSGGPNITATSLPDDYVHYRHPRSPTVREWARIQTFPDWYIFKGPRTTGGRRRAGDPSAGIWDREVPKYTQIGNAVPALLAFKIGEHLRSILLRTRPAA
jgi:DNA (cytosine-5)-methyltransferase 1